MKKALLVLVAVAIIGGIIWKNMQPKEDLRFAQGNGRLEATEISISAKLAGRIDTIMVQEGDFVEPGQSLVQMQLNSLNAALAQAVAKKNQAVTNEASARAQVLVCQSKVGSANAVATQKKSVMEGSKKNFDRVATLLKKDMISQKEYDDSESTYLAAAADYESALADIHKEEATVAVAQADAESAKAAIEAAEADIASVRADIEDSLLVAPRRGRIQYRIAQPGEVVSAGGRVLNLVDLTDVYMTFFLPEKSAGKVAIGAEVRIVLDALPDYPIPAEISYVASVAQFTPKTVETESERQKMMFRVKARVAPELLEEHIEMVKTGLPGVAWVKLDSNADWPENLKINKVQKETSVKADQKGEEK